MSSFIVVFGQCSIGCNKGGVVLFRGKDRVSCIGPKQFIFFFGIGRLVLITLSGALVQSRLRAGGSPTCPTIRTRCSSTTTTTMTLTPTAHDERTHQGSTPVVEALPLVEGGRGGGRSRPRSLLETGRISIRYVLYMHIYDTVCMYVCTRSVPSATRSIVKHQKVLNAIKAAATLTTLVTQ